MARPRARITHWPSTDRFPMQILNDLPAYDVLQRHLVRAMAEEVRDKLQQAAAAGASLNEAVESITFGLATIVDGIRDIGHDDAPVIPVLMFGTFDAADQLAGVVSRGDCSRLHEYAVEAARLAMKPEDRAPNGTSAEAPAALEPRMALVRIPTT